MEIPVKPINDNFRMFQTGIGNKKQKTEEREQEAEAVVSQIGLFPKRGNIIFNA